MLTVLAAIALAPIHFSTVELYPTDDIWVYPHAADAGTDTLMRIWGQDGEAVADSASESESFGYGFLKFDVANLPKKALKSAVLVVTCPAKPTFTLEQAKKSPLEARPVSTAWNEKDWQYSQLSKNMPDFDKGSVYGSGFPAAVSEDKDFSFEVDLLKGPNSFAKAIENAKGGTLGIALASTLAPSEEARSVYKVYTKEGPKEGRPKLKLVFED